MWSCYRLPSSQGMHRMQEGVRCFVGRVGRMAERVADEPQGTDS